LSLDDLLGKKLGVWANTGVEDHARGALGKSVLSFASIDQAFKQLAEKKLDAPSVGGVGCSDGQQGLGAAFV
jgi:ABC-type amino acid transport substrate-binding protein